MSFNIRHAIDIDRIKPKQNGLLICTDAETKTYKSVTVEELPITVNDTTTTLGAFLEDITSKYNKLVDLLMKQ